MQEAFEKQRASLSEAQLQISALSHQVFHLREQVLSLAPSLSLPLSPSLSLSLSHTHTHTHTHVQCIYICVYFDILYVVCI